MPYKNKEDERASKIRSRPQRRAYMRKYRAANLEQERLRTKEWWAIPENRAKAISRQGEYAKAHPEINKAAKAKYLARKRKEPGYKAEVAAKARARRAANPEKHRLYNRTYAKHRRETDVNFAIKEKLRARLYKKITSQGIRKSSSSMALTGCTADFLRGYLEARFVEGMTWANVHIDHRIPCAEFDLRDPAQQKQCFHYSNLKPMLGVDNMRKGAKRPSSHQAELI